MMWLLKWVLSADQNRTDPVSYPDSFLPRSFWIGSFGAEQLTKEIGARNVIGA